MIQQIRAVTHQMKGGYVTLTTSFLRKEHTMVLSTLTQTMEIELLLCDSLIGKGPCDLPSSGVVSLVVDIEDTRATFPSSIVLPYLKWLHFTIANRPFIQKKLPSLKLTS